MTPENITALALANGFKLKTQPDGSEALNPYVFDFARALLENTTAAKDMHEMGVPMGETVFNAVHRVYFRAGLLACREQMARFVQAQDPAIATSIRANWWPELGVDPGAPRLLDFSELADGGKEGPWTAKEVCPSVEALPIAAQFLVAA